MRSTQVRSGLWAIGAGSAVVLVLLSAPSAQRFAPAFVFDAGARGLRATKAAIVEGYRVAPALMLGLGLAIGFPLLTIAFRVIREVRMPADATRLYRPGHDFVEIASRGKNVRYAISGDMLRIGREDDNDIRIASKAVHRYHAAIYREDYNDWHITDLSGVESNGLIVNGRRCCEARLHDGDLIELGPGKLRFRSGSA
ncbi:MAG: FHA domain-containing protein [Hyphomicrobium denitrificans]|nr:FHA domain-containing protein [Hyphomicrobium denitrificans]